MPNIYNVYYNFEQVVNGENMCEVCTVKNAIYYLCGQRPPGLYDQNSMHGWFCTEKFLWWMTTCRMWPCSDCQIFHSQSHSPGVGDHSRVHIYLVVGLCKLETTFCVNFELQGCKISLYIAVSAF